MACKLFKSSQGFTYIAALVLVIVLGIMLGAASQSWTLITQREREKELLFRGAQIRDAIARWYKPSTVGGPPPSPLRDLKDLLKDPRTPGNVRYLRRLYTDPMTDKDWNVLQDLTKGIYGVASTSEEKPIKQDFTDYPKDSPEFRGFGAKSKYSDWQFDYRQLAIAGAGKQQVPGQKPVVP